jgi:phosphomannomutase/phosphoglucomutase
VTPAGQGTGLAPARQLLIRAIAIVSALLLAGAIAYSWTMELLAHGERAQATARQAALSLSTYGHLLAAHAQELAQDATVPRGTAASGDAPRSAFPGVQSVQLIKLGPLGIADPGFRKGSLHNNIEIRLVGRAFNGEKPPTEAYRDNGSWILIAAAPVAAAQGTAGAVLVRADLATVVRDHLPLAHDSGEFSVWSQGADGIYLPVLQPGRARGDAEPHYRAATDIRPLYAGFEPASRLSLRLSLGITALVLGVAAAGLLLITLVLRTFRALAAALDADTAKLTGLALLQRNTTATLPALSWHELAALGEALVQLRRDQQPGAPGPGAVAARPSRPAPDALEIVEESLEIEEDAEAPPEIPAEIFRDYDIRGRSAQIAPQLAHALGRAIGSEALDRQCASIMVGADGRESSPRLREQLVKGLLSTGIDVIDTGTVATPMLYFACHHLRTLSGVMITGSHNPADHNGFKVMIGGETLRGAGILRLRERIEHALFHEGQGSYRVTEIDADYIKAVADDVLVDGRHKVVIDCGNGAASVIAEDLFRELGCDVVPLFCELDSRFPNHHPDPAVPENLRALIAKVAETGAALGIAFDGDADRIGVVSASGSIVTADRLMMLLVREVLASHPGADVVFDVKCSRDLAAVVRANGGRPIMCRSGHSWIKEKMKESGALLGGEFTGHICFRDRWFGFDDALYCAARLLELLAAGDRSLDELLAELPHSVATPEIRIEMPEEQKFAAMEAISRGFSLELENARLSRIDGVRVEFADGWGLVRASNTSAALICRFEGRDEATLARIQACFLAEIRRLLPGTNVSF